MRFVFDSARRGCGHSLLKGEDYEEAAAVTENDRYGGASAYGFLTETERRARKRLALPELNSGFETVYWCQNRILTEISEDPAGCYGLWDGQGEVPLTFAAEVPQEGNYEVTVGLYAEEDVTDAMIFLGRRRLAFLGNLLHGTRLRRTFVTNICPIIPRGYENPEKDTTLDVTVIGKGLRLVEVKAKPWTGPTVYIAGDSTVTDQSADYPYLPENCYSGWGQMLSFYLGCRMAVSNHAHSGLTTESFRSEGHYSILLDRIAPGDLCLFQFGHNDQKLDHLKAEEGYRKNLQDYISEIRQKGAQPVLVTPLARNTWKGDGTYNDLLKPYAEECLKIGRELNVPVLDLHKLSMELILSLGCERAKRYFHPSDYTHSNDYGALRFAGMIFDEMIKNALIPGEPSQNEQRRLWEPPEVLRKLTIPKEYEGIPDPARQELFSDLERPNDLATRADAFGFVNKALNFFPTNVYNDMFSDVIGHETWAGDIECAWQNGVIPEEMIRDGKIYPRAWITGQELMQVILAGYQGRRPLPEPGSGGSWAGIMTDAMTVLVENFSGNGYLTRKTAAEIVRKFQI